MTEYTVVLKNGHCFRVECEHSLPVALWEAHRADVPVIEHESFALVVGEVAAIYPAENDVKGGPKMPTSDIRFRTAV